MSTPTQPGTDLTSVLSLEERGFPFETELSLAQVARFWTEIGAQMGSIRGSSRRLISLAWASRPDLAEVHTPLARPCAMRSPPVSATRSDGDVASNLDPEAASEFQIANIAGSRVAGRGGVNRAALTGLADIALKALR